MSITIDPNDRRTHRFKVISLDVWGHGPEEHQKYDCEGDCDGYTVNDAHYTGRTIEVSASRHDFNPGTSFASSEYYADEGDIVRALVEAAMLTPDCTPEAIEVDGEEDGTLYVNRREDACPLLQLERTE